MAELRKLDLSWKESLLDLYCMTVSGGRFRTFRIVSLILSFTFVSPSTLFQRLIISSLCLTLIVHPHISGHSPDPDPEPSSLQLPSFSCCESPVLHSSNWSPKIAKTRSSQIRSETPFLRRMIHLPPERLRGSSQTGLRTPEWKSK